MDTRNTSRNHRFIVGYPRGNSYFGLTQESVSVDMNMKKPHLIGRILATFGYAKVPKEAVQLSLWLESQIEAILLELKTEPSKVYFQKILKGQQELTKLLRSGRLIAK